MMLLAVTASKPTSVGLQLKGKPLLYDELLKSKTKSKQNINLWYISSSALNVLNPPCAHSLELDDLVVKL